MVSRPSQPSRDSWAHFFGSRRDAMCHQFSPPSGGAFTRENTLKAFAPQESSPWAAVVNSSVNYGPTYRVHPGSASLNDL